MQIHNDIECEKHQTYHRNTKTLFSRIPARQRRQGKHEPLKWVLDSERADALCEQMVLRRSLHPA